MKVTIDVPDELYRRVKAKAALQGRTIREVTAELYQDLAGGRAGGSSAYPRAMAGGVDPPWRGNVAQCAARPYRD